MTAQHENERTNSTIVLRNMIFAKRPCASSAALLTMSAARPKNVRRPVKQTMASISPRLMIDPILSMSPVPIVTGNDSPVSADWSTSSGLPSFSLQSAGTMSPSLMLMRSPGTSIFAARIVNLLSRFVLQRGASDALSASMASPAERSS